MPKRISRAILAALPATALPLGLAAPLAQAQPGLYEERYRPQIHFTPPQNWTNDPNGLVYADGEYHLFYQYNPKGIDWGHMSWGHAVSRDFVHWENLPVAIPEADGVMAFSGSAVFDEHNTSGLGTPSNPPLVAIYAGNRTKDGNQSQYIASSTDHGRTWTRYAHNPVIDIHSNNFRDPKVFWYEPAACWVMVVALSDDHKIFLYRSPNLREWTKLSEFGPAGATGGAWECPDMFPLPLKGSDVAPLAVQAPAATTSPPPSPPAPPASQAPGTKWVLLVNTGNNGPTGGWGTQYFVGSFDGKTFTPDAPPASPSAAPAAAQPLWLDQGPDCYAAVTWSNLPDDRRVLLGWMVSNRYAGSVPTSPWRGGMTLPRELSLHATPSGPRLFQRPIHELHTLRYDYHTLGRGEADAINTRLRDVAYTGQTLTFSTIITPAPAGACGIKVRTGHDQSTLIGYDADKHCLFVDRTRAGDASFSQSFAQRTETPVELVNGQVSLEVWVDAGSVEVFANDGQTVMTDLIFPDPTSQGVQCWSDKPGTMFSGFEVWKLDSIWPQPPAPAIPHGFAR